MNPASAKVEEYLETIYNMDMENEVVIGARLAEKFQVKAPSVTEMLQRLEKAGYVTLDSQRHVNLTDSGVEMAEAVLRRHRLTERFLTDMLGMQWHQVHEEACRLEHYISGAVEARVITSLDHPTTCPHGNPIPGYVEDARNYLTRNQARRFSETDGEATLILCVSEVVEDEEDIIRQLHEYGLTPGSEVTLTAKTDETCNVLLEGKAITIPQTLAHALWVVPAEAGLPVGAAGSRK